ncbi:hypothetical protein QBC32DRAFT_2504 [Pseudoneurospora amorphoporcata]|uniref:Uncharacterized protein n=1 Tax=Pseudoneurospora amorphoporcata TaxID=241081 RepID=A0AAN6SJU5_9PEZI|nr:hypothetical protein QBC32DRAFT_2504 [Pseudoneurospora amorphoporcata]
MGLFGEGSMFSSRSSKSKRPKPSHRSSSSRKIKEQSETKDRDWELKRRDSERERESREREREVERQKEREIRDREREREREQSPPPSRALYSAPDASDSSGRRRRQESYRAERQESYRGEERAVVPRGGPEGEARAGQGGTGGLVNFLASLLLGDDDDLDGMGYGTDSDSDNPSPRRSSPPKTPKSRGGGHGMYGGENDGQAPRDYFSLSRHNSSRLLDTFGGGTPRSSHRDSGRPEKPPKRPSFFKSSSSGRRSSFFAKFRRSSSSSSSFYKRSPRPRLIKKLLKKLKRLLRDLAYYAQRHPMKVFMLAIMPLITGGALTGLLAKLGIRLPKIVDRLLALAAKYSAGDSLGAVGEVARLARDGIGLGGIVGGSSGGGSGKAAGAGAAAMMGSAMARGFNTTKVERGRGGDSVWEKRTMERDRVFDGPGGGLNWQEGLRSVLKMLSD